MEYINIAFDSERVYTSRVFLRMVYDMNKMIHIADMHCHILPGLDDGSKSMEQTISMLKIAYDEGVRLIIATPHYHIGRMMVEQSKIDAAIESITPVIRDNFPDMEIYAGQEIYYYSEAVEALNDNKARTMAGSGYILLEYSPDESYDVISSSIYEAETNGYVPIIAHIERYSCVHDRTDRVAELIESGAYIQVNAGTVTGGMGRSSKKFVKKLLKEHMVHFISSDAHSDRTRAPRFSEAVKALGKICKPDYCMELLWDNAIKVINNEEI